MTLMDRRQLLRSLALGAGSLPLLDLGRRGLRPGGRLAHAADGAPKRLLLIADPFGFHEGTGMASVGKPGGPDAPARHNFGGTTEVTPEFTLLGLSQPLEPVKKDLVMVVGLEQTPHKNDDLHQSGYRNCFTAADYDPKSFRTKGPSLDVVLDQKIGRVTNPSLPSLALDVQVGQDHQFFWQTDGTPRPTNPDPFDVYAKLFANLTGGTSSGPDPKLVALLARRKSVLDVVAQDLGDFKRRLPAEDRVRADAQLDAISTLEARLGKAAGAPVQGCAKPVQPAKFDLRSGKNHLEILRLQLDNIAAAFACDLTRIASLGIDANYGCDFAPVNNVKLPHDLSHDFRDQHVAWRRAHNEAIAAFAQKLKNIPEGSGSMLDNTIIVIGSDITHGHTHRHSVFFVIGGKNLGINVGNWLGFREGITTNNTRFGGTPHGQMLASISTAMGNPTDYFGSRTWLDIDGPGKDAGGGQDNGGNVPAGLLPGLLRG
jgi:hypothetical protein